MLLRCLIDYPYLRLGDVTDLHQPLLCIVRHGNHSQNLAPKLGIIKIPEFSHLAGRMKFLVIIHYKVMDCHHLFFVAKRSLTRRAPQKVIFIQVPWQTKLLPQCSPQTQ